MAAHRANHVSLLALHFVCASAAYAQPAPAFEVASVRRLDPARARPTGSNGAIGSTGAPTPVRENPASVNYDSTNLRNILIRAYQLQKYQISGPSWLDSERYAIHARLPEGATIDQIPAMLRHLLEERFGMKVHWEEKPAATYSLVAGKNIARMAKFAMVEAPPAAGSDAPTNRAFSFDLGGRLEFKQTTMEDFANTLTLFVGLPVRDDTGLKGIYGFTLDAAIDPTILGRLGTREAGSSSDAAVAPSIFTAIRELGLRLESRKAPLKMLVVDSANRDPSENEL